MQKHFVTIGALLGGLAVVAGAFGAHGLKQHVTPDRLDIFHTGVEYQMYHALALLLLAWRTSKDASQLPVIASWCFIIGCIVFSGSLYLLVILGQPWLGAITPIGGVAFIVGWGCLMFSAWRKTPTQV